MILYTEEQPHLHHQFGFIRCDSVGAKVSPIMPSQLIPEHVDLLGNPAPVLKWLEEQDVGSQERCEFTEKNLPQEYVVC